AAKLLSRRARWLSSRALQPRWGTRLTTPYIPSWIGITGWIIAFLVGWWLAALGQESEINLLSLPLIGIILWNVAVCLLSLPPVKPRTAPAWVQRILSKFDRLPVEADPASTPEGIGLERFQTFTAAPALHRFYLRFRGWLHIGAALLALGSITAMYARGWSKEYRAVWESTLLDDSSAKKFFSVLFAPAAAITGNPVPVANVHEMRRRADAKAPTPGEALPWIHLYAVTLGLTVVFPRALLLLLELLRSARVPSREILSSDWQSYTQGLLGMVPGSGASAVVITHGLPHDAPAKDRWRQWAHRRWRDVGQIEYHSVPVGGEAEFVAALPAPGARCLLAFNMATVPEAEVQRWLVEALLNLMRQKSPAPMLLLALDDADLRRRWSGFADMEKRLSDKAQSWKTIMDGLNVSWVA
ncbi:MAG: DUF2868 domain-containing protein, partial [Verrucomicrobium sp.]